MTMRVGTYSKTKKAFYAGVDYKGNVWVPETEWDKHPKNPKVKKTTAIHKAGEGALSQITSEQKAKSKRDSLKIAYDSRYKSSDPTDALIRTPLSGEERKAYDTWKGLYDNLMEQYHEAAGKFDELAANVPDEEIAKINAATPLKPYQGEFMELAAVKSKKVDSLTRNLSELLATDPMTFTSMEGVQHFAERMGSKVSIDRTTGLPKKGSKGYKTDYTQGHHATSVRDTSYLTRDLVDDPEALMGFHRTLREVGAPPLGNNGDQVYTLSGTTNYGRFEENPALRRLNGVDDHQGGIHAQSDPPKNNPTARRQFRDMLQIYQDETGKPMPLRERVARAAERADMRNMSAGNWTLQRDATIAESMPELPRQTPDYRKGKTFDLSADAPEVTWTRQQANDAFSLPMKPVEGVSGVQPRFPSDSAFAGLLPNTIDDTLPPQSRDAVWLDKGIRDKAVKSAIKDYGIPPKALAALGFLPVVGALLDAGDTYAGTQQAITGKGAGGRFGGVAQGIAGAAGLASLSPLAPVAAPVSLAASALSFGIQRGEERKKPKAITNKFGSNGPAQIVPTVAPRSKPIGNGKGGLSKPVGGNPKPKPKPKPTNKPLNLGNEVRYWGRKLLGIKL